MLITTTDEGVQYSLAYPYDKDIKGQKSKSNNFSGVLQLKNLEGKQLHQFTFNDGRLTQMPINKNKTGQGGKTTMSIDCVITYSCSWNYYCSTAEGLYVTATIGEICGNNRPTYNPCPSSSLDYVSWSFVGSDEIGRTCTDNGLPPVNPPPPPPGGGGGGTGTVGSEGSTADHGLKGKGNLPPIRTDDVQVGATCVFKTVEWISRFFNGKITAGSSLNDYRIKYNLSLQQIAAVINTDGVPGDRLLSIVDKYFNYNVVTNIKESIDAGHPLFASIIYTPTSGHEVMITGYFDNGLIEYFDPMDGSYQKSRSTDFKNLLEVTSQK